VVGPGANHGQAGLGSDAAGAGEVGGEGRAQLGATGGVTVTEGGGRGLAEAAPECPCPGGARESGQVWDPGVEVEAEAGLRLTDALGPRRGERYVRDPRSGAPRETR
jgi:hypothetical protein